MYLWKEKDIVRFLLVDLKVRFEALPPVMRMTLPVSSGRSVNWKSECFIVVFKRDFRVANDYDGGWCRVTSAFANGDVGRRM